MCTIKKGNLIALIPERLPTEAKSGSQIILFF